MVVKLWGGDSHIKRTGMLVGRYQRYQDPVLLGCL